MQHLRGGAQVVRRGDPVFLWKIRKRVIVKEIYQAHGKSVDKIDLSNAPASARILTATAGRVKLEDINIALVDTPNTFGAAMPECTLVLPGVNVQQAIKAALSTKTVVIGVGRAPF